MAVKAQKEAELKAAYPDKPWMWRADWAAGEIQDQTRSWAGILWGVALVWYAVAIPSAIVDIHEALRPGGKPAAWLVLIFPVAGLFLIAKALHYSLPRRKFGKSVFRLTTLPGVIGGKLAGTIHVEREVGAQAGVKLRLICRRRSNQNARDSVNALITLWEDQQTLDRLPPATQGSDIPVYFHIPDDAKPCDRSDPIQQVFWQLEASAGEAGVDYFASFDVPVFVTDVPQDVPDAAAAFRRTPSAQGPANVHGISISNLADGGCRTHFAAAENLGLTMKLALYGAIFGGICVFGLFKWHSMLGLPFGLIGLGLAIGAVRLLLVNSTVIVNRRGVTVERGLPFLRRAREFAVGDIQKLYLKVAVEDNAGVNVYYAVMLRTADGQQHNLSTSIMGEENAQLILEKIEKSLGNLQEEKAE